MNKTTILQFFLFFVSLLQGQDIVGPKKINGKIIASSNDLEGIYVVNLKTEKSTATEQGGYFFLTASVGDTLMFSSVQFKSIKVALKENDFQKELLFVQLEPMVRLLDEVKIEDYKKVDAVSVGVIPAKIKTATPAERKMYTATTGSGILPLDPILNAISGRTSMLKKEVKVEKKEFLIQKIDNLFSEKYFIETLKIPQVYVRGFEYYLVEDKEFTAAMKSRDKTLATFIMGELAAQYLELKKEK